MPTAEGLDTSGLDLSPGTLEQLISVDNESWRAELEQIDSHYDALGNHVPAELRDELSNLEKRLAS